MTRSRRRDAVASLAALTAALLPTGCAADDTAVGGAQSSASTGFPVDAEGNDADVAFLQLMLPHHAQAIEMSELILGKDAVAEEVSALAEQVVAAQQPEIDQMTGWLRDWDEDLPQTGGGMVMDHAMNGMLAQADVDAIASATGADAARLYLQGLKAHHQGAIVMAQGEIEDGASRRVISFAQDIVEAQQAEIAMIDELLTAA